MELAVVAELVVRVALVEPAVQVAQAAWAAWVELAAQEVRVELVVLVAAKLEHARVAVELELDQVEAKLEHGRVEVELAHVQVAAPAKIKLVTAAPRHGQVRVPKRVEDLAAAAAETTRAPAATEVAEAWVAAGTVAAVAAADGAAVE